MSTFIMKNVQKGLKAIVFTPDYKLRSVASKDKKGITEQCIVDGDVVIYMTSGSGELNNYIQGRHASYVTDESIYKTHIDDVLLDFLNNDELTLPADYGWDGENTINNLVFDYGLDKFFTGFLDNAILGGLVGLTSDLTVPHTGSFNTDMLFKHCKMTITNAASETQLTKLLDNVDVNYRDWLNKDGVIIPEESINWNKAKKLPKTLSVSCILKDGTPLRFNDLVVFRDGDVEPEVISIFDIVTTFNMIDTNFITLPYVIDEDVTRVMYIVHGNKLTPAANNAVWLYRKR